MQILSSRTYEDAITPERPYISDTFNGSVRHPVFGVTVKELKGSAMSDDEKHVALITDRSTSIGQRILTENATFVSDTKNGFFSLSQRVADDGEVTIFSVSKIEFMAVFDLFEMRLPSSSNENIKCESYGKPFGRRCYKTESFNWDNNADMPSEIEIPVKEIQNKIKLFGGISANAEASFLLRKTGAFNAQLELDASLAVSLGVGFYVEKIDYHSTDPIDIGDKLNQKIGEITITIFEVPINVNVLLVGGVQLENLGINVPNDITYIKKYKLMLKKGCTLSLNGFNSPDMTKEFTDDFVDQNNNILDEKPDVNMKIEGNFSFSIGIRVEVNFDKVVKSNIYIEGGAKAGVEFKYGINTTKCPSPAFYGTVRPSVSSYIKGGGSLSVFGITVLNGELNHLSTIWEKQIGDEDGSCLFDSLSSNELEDDLISKNERKRYVVKVSNPVFKKDENQDYQIQIIAKNKGTQKSQIKYYKFSKNLKGYYTDCYFYMNETNTYDEFTIKSFDLNKEVVITNVDIMNTYKYSDDNIEFDLILNETTPISKIGTEFPISNINGYYNYKTDGLQGKYKTMALIIHSNVTGYTSSYNNYYMMDEYYDDEQDNVYNIKTWMKVTVTEVTTEDEKKCNSKYRLTQIYKDQIYRMVETSGCISGTNKISFIDVAYEVPIINPGNGDEVSLKLNFEVDGATKEIGITNSDLQKSTLTKQIDETYSISFKIESFQNIEYLTELSDSYKNTLKEYEKLSGIFCKLYEPLQSTYSYQRSPYNGNEITLQISFDINEVYGVLRFLFNGDGYDFTHLYILVKLPGIQPLIKEDKVLQDNIYLIKLQLGISLYKTKIDDPNDKQYDIVIPFRKRSKPKAKETTEIIFYSIFQSPVNNENKPDCSEFPLFKVPQMKQVYFGCIKSYANKAEFENNKMQYFTTADVSFYQNVMPKDSKDDSHSNLIRMNPTTDSSSTNLNVILKQEYIDLNKEMTQLTIDNSTIENINSYFDAQKSFKIKCERCDSIYIDDISEDTRIQKSNDEFIIYTKSYTKGFTVLPYCNENTSINCIFALNVENFGTFLLRYDKSVDDKKADIGVNEYFNWNNEEVKSNRLSIGCKYQIIDGRKGTIYGIKNWEGPVIAAITNIDTNHISIQFTTASENGNTTITLKSGENIIPFSHYVYSSANDEELKTYLEEIGITLSKTKEEISKSNDFIIDEEGKIIVKDTYYKGENAKKNIEDKKQIHLLDLKQDYYTMTYNGAMKIGGIPILGWILIGISIFMVI
ncbi:hypothetical protein GPJ56_008187 [Histomonas meleagridis]|uniref:uncharacterized protein n=1 Tax=Histomonas meleagridis TaxID=135588 RepID=UPI0035595EB1|nr:hypothetical protein GPJ56_008187 [Histomonas meleagridis]KAH0797208.1 hypothetical protein GO595_009890 [Histomonas meleagridis]